MANKILASSLDNFIQMNTSNPANLPYVTFSFTTMPSSGVVISISDANDANGYKKEIKGTPSGETTINSFNTSGDAVYTLMECLRMNNIFYGITVVNPIMVRAMLDTSITYRIVSTAGVTVGGNFASFSPSLPNKSVVIMQESGVTDTSIVMEKYHNAQTVTFNLTSPFQKTMFRTPLEYNVKAYTLTDGTAHSADTAPYDKVTIMPTTLTKFQSVNYNDYLYTGSGKVKFLTTQYNRYYNYGEWVGFSFLSNTSNITPSLKKCFYTNSGVFLEEEWTTQYIEKNGKRYDIYDTFELNDIEAAYDKQVGYIMVYLTNGNGSDEVLADPIRFDVIPHCDGNNEIFFLNELGGIDSFNFTSTKQITRSIGSQTTYNVNHIKPFERVLEHQYVNSKVNKVVTTLSTNQLGQDIASWLNQLVKSKYVFKFLGVMSPMYKMIVVDKFDVQTNTADSEFELTLEYRDADNEISL